MFYLYSYPTKEEASTCYKSVQAKRDEILSLLTDMNDKQERVNLVQSYATNPNPPVYSSEFRGVDWFKRDKKWPYETSDPARNLIQKEDILLFYL
jgi:hypothetical protein